MTQTPRSLTEATDQAITKENADFIKTLCPFCMGTGSYYAPVAGARFDKGSVRHTCSNCRGTGEFADMPDHIQRMFRK